MAWEPYLYYTDQDSLVNKDLKVYYKILSLNSAFVTCPLFTKIYYQ